jgi:ELWxxDGT repeat protein
LSFSAGFLQPTRVVVGDSRGPRPVTFGGSPLLLPEGANSSVVAVGDLLFAVGGNKTYRLDPEQATATLIADAEVVGRYPEYGRYWNGIAYASGRDAYGNEPWRSDGTAAGTRRIADLAPGGADGVLGAVAAVRDDLVYFAAVDQTVAGAAQRGLWRTDGTVSGTRVLDRSLYGDGDVQDIRSFGDGIAFFTYGGSRQRAYYADPGLTSVQALWEPDGWSGSGSLQGDETLLVSLCPWINPGSESVCAFRADGLQQPVWLGSAPLPSTFRALDHTINHRQLYFRGGSLWRTDGTAPGTFVLAALVQWPDYLMSAPILSYAFGGQLYFHACTPSLDACALYATDGTAAPQPLASIRGEIGGYAIHAGELAFLTMPGSRVPACVPSETK